MIHPKWNKWLTTIFKSFKTNNKMTENQTSDQKEKPNVPIIKYNYAGHKVEVLIFCDDAAVAEKFAEKLANESMFLYNTSQEVAKDTEIAKSDSANKEDGSESFSSNPDEEEEGQLPAPEEKQVKFMRPVPFQKEGSTGWWYNRDDVESGPYEDEAVVNAQIDILENHFLQKEF